MKPNIICDIQATQNEPSAKRGIGRYVTEHARSLLRTGSIRALLLNPRLPPPVTLDDELATSGLIDWNTATAIRHAAREGPFIYHVMSPFEMSSPAQTVVSPHVLRQEIPLAVTLYDLVPLAMPEQYLDNPYFAPRYRARLNLLLAADVLLALSEQSRIDAMTLLGVPDERIAVIGGGVSPAFRPPKPDERPLDIVHRVLPTVAGPYVLSSTGADERKNVDRLLEAWAALPVDLRSSVQLVLTGSLRADYAERWRRRLKTLGLIEGANVVFTDWIPDSVLVPLYQAALLFVFPSLYEGFGLPVAEAAACDCAVVTSSSPPLPEILDYPPSLFDGKSVDQMSALLERALTDSDFTAALLEASRRNAPRHTWAAVASRTLDALGRLARVDRFVPRTRVAVLGAMTSDDPPGRRNRALVEALGPACEVDAFWTDQQAPSVARVNDVRFRPSKALNLTCNAAAYDAVIYSLDRATPVDYPGVFWQHARAEPPPPTQGPGRMRRLLAALARRWFGHAAARLITPGQAPVVGAPPRSVVASSMDPSRDAQPAVLVITPADPNLASRFLDLIDNLPPALPPLDAP